MSTSTFCEVPRRVRPATLFGPPLSCENVPHHPSNPAVSLSSFAPNLQTYSLLVYFSTKGRPGVMQTPTGGSGCQEAGTSPSCSSPTSAPPRLSHCRFPRSIAYSQIWAFVPDLGEKRNCPTKQASAYKTVHYRDAVGWRSDRIVADVYGLYLVVFDIGDALKREVSRELRAGSVRIPETWRPEDCGDRISGYSVARVVLVNPINSCDTNPINAKSRNIAWVLVKIRHLLIPSSREEAKEEFSMRKGVVCVEK
ncbi:hypothetical protein H4582DRAFT_2056527 [Lactarius indigo]|nr:hypothetical protein H4582DRAFT_2056527 [Lactarius indigo]